MAKNYNHKNGANQVVLEAYTLESTWKLLSLIKMMKKQKLIKTSA